MPYNQYSLIADAALLAGGKVLSVRYKDANTYDHQSGMVCSGEPPTPGRSDPPWLGFGDSAAYQCPGLKQLCIIKYLTTQILPI